jgi:uncharacterized GH25 family protein
LTVVAAPVAVDAHEFWLESSAYRPPANSVVRVTLWLGERFAGQPVLHDADHCVKFELVGPGGASPVLGRSGGMTAFARVASEGTYVLGYPSKRYFHTMTPDAFEAYLKEEGLDGIVEARKQRGESEKAGREAYSRYAKSILTVGEGATEGFDRRARHPLEIVPQQHPAGVGSERRFAVLLLYEDRPLADAAVVAVSRSAPRRLLRTTTGRDGRAEFLLPESGVWMITSLHMVRSADAEQADWESFWASLTFELPRPAGDSAAPAAPSAEPRTAAGR